MHSSFSTEPLYYKFRDVIDLIIQQTFFVWTEARCYAEVFSFFYDWYFIRYYYIFFCRYI